MKNKETGKKEVKRNVNCRTQNNANCCAAYKAFKKAFILAFLTADMLFKKQPFGVLYQNGTKETCLRAYLLGKGSITKKIWNFPDLVGGFEKVHFPD